MAKVKFTGVLITGCDRGWWLHDSVDGNGPWGIMWDSCEVTGNNQSANPGSLANYAIYAADFTTLGVDTTVKRCRFVGLNNNAIYANNTQGANLLVEDCIIEATAQEAINWTGVGAGDSLRIRGGHMEQIWNSLVLGTTGAYWNGTYYQRSSSDSAAAALIRFGQNVNQPIICDIDGLDANCSDYPGLTGSGAAIDGIHCFPLLSMTSGRISLKGNVVVNMAPGSNPLNQPVVRTDYYTVFATIDGLYVPAGMNDAMELVTGNAYPLASGVMAGNPRDDRPATLIDVGKGGLGCREWSGGAAPGTLNFYARVGDHFWRTDTPGTANQRLYVCTVAGRGAGATWVGIL